MGKALGDLGAAMSAALTLVGDRLGLYKAMKGAGWLSSAEVAKRAGVAERSVREWLLNQAAGGYVEHDAKTGKFRLPDEQAMALAEEGSPVFVQGAFQVTLSVFRDLAKIEESFRTGNGLGWGEHDASLFEGTERFFRPGYNANLVSSWIPALEGVKAKLERGAKVADVGCGHGASTILMAKAFPKSTFVGLDYHKPSIEWATRAAKEAGVAKNTKFEVARSTDYPGKGFDLVAFFDCLHDMADPAAVAKHVRESLAPDGTWMIVEPMAKDRVEENLHPIGRLFYAASTTICVQASLSEKGIAIGAQAGEAKLRELLAKGGFTRIRRAAETPFNMILEARA